MDFGSLPGGDLIEAGLADLQGAARSIPALLVAIGAPRLRALGVAVPARVPESPERELYALLAEQAGDAAHARYNALIRRLVSFERALACVAR
jgi:hypothetical protein